METACLGCETSKTLGSPIHRGLTGHPPNTGLALSKGARETPKSPDYVPGPKEPEQAPLLPDFVPGPEYPKYLAPSDEEVPVKDQPYAIADSPIALSLGYVADSDPKEDFKDGPVDYPTDGGDGDDDDSFDNDKEEEASEEEEEHLAPADSVVAPVVDHVPSYEETKPSETDKSTATPPAFRTTAKISIRPEAPMPFPSEEEVERLLALPIPPLISLSPPSAEEHLARCLAAPALPSSPLPIVPHPYGSPNHVRAPPGFRAAMASLFIPPVDHREETSEAELPPRKRLFLTPLTSRYGVGESSTATPRHTGGHGVDYGFIGTVDAEVRRQRVEEVGYGIRDVLVDLVEAVEEVTSMTLEGVNDRVTELAAVQEQDTQDIYAVIEDTQDRTNTQMQDYRIASQESLTATLIAHVSALQGQFSVALGQIQALQTRGQTHADDREGAASTNNMPPRRSSATARAAATAAARTVAATPMTTAVVEQLIKARVSAALANHETF
ncbi:hypothetical protein Tco_0366033 [Tanacetum coccineum]